jgi:hypothetical protein
MRIVRASVILGVILVIGCKAEVKMDGDSAAPASASMAATPISLADLAGQWQVTLRPADRDTVVLTYDLTATADTLGWTTTFPGRPPLPMHVVPPTGDSIIVHMGPYESALRKGVPVTSEVVNRLEGGKLVGTVTATYKTAAGDSVVKFRTEGTKKM